MPLVQLEPLEAAGDHGAETRVSFAGEEESPDPDPSCRENLRRLEWLVLGYDVDADEGRRTAPNSTNRAI